MLEQRGVRPIGGFVLRGWLARAPLRPRPYGVALYAKRLATKAFRVVLCERSQFLVEYGKVAVDQTNPVRQGSSFKCRQNDQDLPPKRNQVLFPPRKFDRRLGRYRSHPRVDLVKDEPGAGYSQEQWPNPKHRMIIMTVFSSTARSTMTTSLCLTPSFSLYTNAGSCHVVRRNWMMLVRIG